MTCLTRCDSGWEGNACNQPITALPNSLRDTFNHQPFIGAGGWSSIHGAELTQVCGPLASGSALHFHLGCTRMLTSNDMDLTEADYLQFHIIYGCIVHPTHRNQSVLVQYSTNGGVQWKLIEEMVYDQYLESRFVSLMLPPGSRQNGTRLRWWQPAHPGEDEADFAIDNVFVGGSSTLPASLRDDFESGSVSDQWLFTDNADVGEFCIESGQTEVGSISPSSLFGGINSFEDTTMTTLDLRLQEGSVLEFKISVGCNRSTDAFMNPVDLFFSSDSGSTWSLLGQQCLTFDPQCHDSQAMVASRFHANQGWRRIIIKLPAKATRRKVRFRWFQRYNASVPHTPQWALDDVYIGPPCPEFCNGHGDCRYPFCACDRGYSGEACEIPPPLPTYLKETFSDGEINSTRWHLVQGASVTQDQFISCGAIHELDNLYFGGNGQRLAETQDLDLRDSKFVQFYLVVGNETGNLNCWRPTVRHESVVIQFSSNGGVSWTTLHELDFNSYTTPQFVYLSLPQAARMAATRVRWWQPWQQGILTAQWAIDSIFIGGSEINPISLVDSFDYEPDESLWNFHPYANTNIGVCGSFNPALYWQGTESEKLNRSLTTREVIVDRNFIVQFKIVVGCSQQPEFGYSCSTADPIRLEYTTTPHSPLSWQLVQQECYPGGQNHHCFPLRYHQGSTYNDNAYSTWTRVTLRVPTKAISGSTQFRWVQEGSREELPSWAIDDVYIGPPCHRLCHGHGRCVQGNCVCDPGFEVRSGTCVPTREFSNNLMENFEGMLLSEMWSVVRGGRIGQGCGGLVPHALGKSLYFSGCDRREAVTVEFDTRLASRINFVLQIGSTSEDPQCHINTGGSDIAMKSVVLQYTNNNGIDWHLLQTHDPRQFGRAMRLSLPLPEGARRHAVRFRWWQPVHDGPNEDQWAIDHIHLDTVLHQLSSIPGRAVDRKRRQTN